MTRDDQMRGELTAGEVRRLHDRTDIDERTIRRWAAGARVNNSTARALEIAARWCGIKLDASTVDVGEGPR